MIYTNSKMKKGYLGTLKIKKMYLGSQQIFSGELEKLATPTNITFSSSTGLISWDAVPNANGYSIYLRNPLYAWTSISTNSVYYKQLTFKYEGNVDYTNISVKALGDGANYLDSDAASYNYIYTTQLPTPSGSISSGSNPVFVMVSGSNYSRVTHFYWETYNGSTLIESGTTAVTSGSSSRTAWLPLTASKYTKGTSYTAKVVARNNTIENTYTDSEIKTITGIFYPNILETPVLDEYTGYSLEWSYVPNADYYEIYRGEYDWWAEQEYVDTTQATNWYTSSSDEGYYYCVRAHSNNSSYQSSDYSNAVYVG